MNRLLTITNWLRAHRKKVIVHGSILSAFLLYAFFLAGPLFDRFEGIDGEAKLDDTSLPGETNNIRYKFSTVANTQVIEILGWAFIEGQSTNNSQIYVVLKSADIIYVFDTMASKEEQDVDLNKQLGIDGSDLSQAGFATFIPTSKINSGEYTIGIYITKGNIEALEYTNRVIVKSGNAVRQVTPN